MTLGICLSLAALAAAPSGQASEPVFVKTQRFTLAWVHSIEKVRWEEDYLVVAGQSSGQSPVLNAVAARVKGSAAGMEPGPDAVLKDGWYVYSPAQKTHQRLELARSFFTSDYEICLDGLCAPMSSFLQSDGGVTYLSACREDRPG